MTVNVYYEQQGKKLILFTENITDFNSLNRFLLFIQQLGSKTDEDIVSLKVIESLASKLQITITSNFLFTNMSKYPGLRNTGSVVDILKANGVNLISQLNNELKEPLLPQSSSKPSFWNKLKLK